MKKCLSRLPVAFPIVAPATALCAALCLLLSACSSTPTKGEAPLPPPNDDSTLPASVYPFTHTLERAKRLRKRHTMELKAGQLYKDAHKRLLNGSYVQASQDFDTLMSKFPFSRYATQAQLEQIYADFRSFKPEKALSDANRFLQEHPRHPHADYALYLEGLINASRNDSITRYLGIDQSDHDPTYLRAAFQDLALLTRRYPKSLYYADARQRMISLRNRIADHDLDITHFYLSRGAWVAAARRAKSIVANYPGAPATAKALLIMKDCYAKLGLSEQEKQVDTLISANRASLVAAHLKPPAKQASATQPPNLTPAPPAPTSSASAAHAPTPSTSSSTPTASAKQAHTANNDKAPQSPTSS